MSTEPTDAPDDSDTTDVTIPSPTIHTLSPEGILLASLDDTLLDLHEQALIAEKDKAKPLAAKPCKTAPKPGIGAASITPKAAGPVSISSKREEVV